MHRLARGIGWLSHRSLSRWYGGVGCIRLMQEAQQRAMQQQQQQQQQQQAQLQVQMAGMALDVGNMGAEERRVDSEDGQAYTRAEFIDAYGGTAEWDAAGAGSQLPAGVVRYAVVEFGNWARTDHH
jgi:hypothetical protein